MRILVTGARGLLGTEVVRAARVGGHKVVALGRAEVDVTDPDAVSACFLQEQPDVVVHCAAYSAVDKAESEPDIAMAVNRGGARNVARSAQSVGSSTVYVSTDYVFDGLKSSPYLTTDETGPISSYGRSKLAGELETLAAYTPGNEAGDGSGRVPSALVVRTGWLYGAAGGNFVQTMLRIARDRDKVRVVDDQVGRPTWARNVAEAIIELIEVRAGGVMHVADAGEATWLDLARQTFLVQGVEMDTAGVSTLEWGADAPRPLYSVLDLGETEGVLGRGMTDWRDALPAFLESL
ncbi:MAG: dTDP-4-dehydrorhamnose reductase [Longimicrobiales bacterium]|nr:dTDP-4-dehydrorhamnose reductase [Longimicrobiales bacterium]